MAEQDKDKKQYNLAYVIIFLTLAILGYVVYQSTNPAPGASKAVESPVLMLIVGQLLGGLMVVYAYFYGSSKGAEDVKKEE